jgi:hypothetical protein
MSASTALIGPYDKLPTHEKIRTQVGIPLTVYERYFKTYFPYRGSQDKILSRLFHLFMTHLETQHPDIATYTNQQREYYANELLNSLARFDLFQCTTGSPSSDGP